MSPDTFAKSYLAVTWEAASYYRSDVEIKSDALEALSALDYVGVCDQIDECIKELALLFGFLNNTIAFENVSPNREILPKLDEDLISLIKRLTSIDQELYDLAKAKISGKGIPASGCANPR